LPADRVAVAHDHVAVRRITLGLGVGATREDA
jgi:hypothetical protein